MTTIDGNELTWRRTGTGRPLVLLHGITDSAACWSRIMGELEGEFDVVALDARGHGRSARWSPEMTPAQMADDAAAVIRELVDEPVVVWGHSMGAATATLLAARHPELVAAVVLEDPPYTTSPVDDTHQIVQLVTGIGQMLAMVREAPEAERLAVAQAMNPAWDDADLPGWVESKLEFDESVLTGRGAIDRDWRTPMASVSAPVLLVVGDPTRGGAVDEDTANALVSAHSDTEVRRFPVGHNVHREAYEDVLAAVRGFVAGH